MYNFTTNKEEYYSELLNIVRLFYPPNNCDDLFVDFSYNLKIQGKILVTISEEKYVFDCVEISSENKRLRDKFTLRHCKICLYNAFKGHCGRSLPWGSLTGIRPTKLFYEMLNDGKSLSNARSELQETFDVSNKKAELVNDIILAQKDYICSDKKLVNLYVHIPFCPSRCSYCSFVTTTIDKQKQYLDDYVNLLCVEIEDTFKILKNTKKEVYSAYIGGGTPTSISDEHFTKILSAISLNLGKSVEFTCEAGRPETITKEKLAIMKANNVTRISVNPQTLSQATLDKISRKHSVQDFFNAYEMAKSFDFDINVDVIAGLDGENINDFANTINGIIQLKPQNITIHTLSRKNGSALSEQSYKDNNDIEEMVELGHNRCYNSGYLPYYLYRQKQMLGNLENVGYCLPNKQCVNNISTMEETISVFACGAGAISKMIFENGRIERLANIKDVKLYIQQFNERLDKRRETLSF